METVTRRPKYAEVVAERDAWRDAALLYRKIAADGVLRLKEGLSYAKAQDLYDKALAAEPEVSRD